MLETAFYLFAFLSFLCLLVILAVIGLYIFSPAIRQCIKDDFNNGSM